jgi:GT2 family glycosyltransferase
VLYPADMSAEAKSSISVVIVNWNSAADLSECLTSLQRQSVAPLEIIVVDNGSSDGSAAMVRQRFPDVKLLANEQNLGFAPAVNQGIEHARGEWVATLNNDTVADSRWIERLLAAADSAPAADSGQELGMLQSCIVFKDRRDQLNSTGVLLFKDATAADRGVRTPSAKADNWSQDIFCPTAGAAAYKRSMLQQVRLPNGVFDASFFMYYEDVDLGWRCRLAGFGARYVPDAVVYHAFQGSSRRHGNRFVLRQCTKNRLISLARNASPELLVRSLPKTLSEILWLAAFGGRGALREVTPRVLRAFREERPLVTSLLANDRRQVERTWLARRRGGGS